MAGTLRVKTISTQKIVRVLINCKRINTPNFSLGYISKSVLIKNVYYHCSNFMVGVPYLNTKTGEYGWGLQGELQSVPMGFTYETSIFYGQGIRGVRTKKRT